MPAGDRPPFLLTLLSTDPEWIDAAELAGVQRIGIDIERVGKQERQHTVVDARISNHELADLTTITSRVQQARPFARLNPLHAGTRAEIEQALVLGAQSLMLPYFRSAHEAAEFTDLVSGRAEVLLLVETKAAVACLHDIVKLPGITEIMVGLNDLHLDLGLSSPMAVAASDLLDAVADQVLSAGLRFGFGGVAGAGTTGLPVAADLLLARYAQVGARSAWIARSFFRDRLQPAEFGSAVTKLRQRLDEWCSRSPDELSAALQALRLAVATAYPQPVQSPS